MAEAFCLKFMGTGHRAFGRLVEQQMEQRARLRMEQQQPSQQEQQQRFSIVRPPQI